MIKEIFEITLFDGISIDEVRNTISQFPHCYVHQSKGSTGQPVVMVECPAENGNAVRKRIEQMRMKDNYAN